MLRAQTSPPKTINAPKYNDRMGNVEQTKRPVALVTGDSRGIGAATARALAERGYDVAITYRNKAPRAEQVIREVEERGVRGLAVGCDMTREADLDHLFSVLAEWCDGLDVVVLNASGGMERDLVSQNPLYPFRINRDAQLALVDRALPLMHRGGTIVFVTSHWAHLFGQVHQLPAYDAVAESKLAGERALRARQDELNALGVRLLIVTGDMIEGTITVKLMERDAPGLTDHRRGEVGGLPTTEEMGEAIAAAATDKALPSGHTLVVGGALESLPRL